MKKKFLHAPKFISLLLIGVLLISSTPAIAFSAIPATHWSYAIAQNLIKYQVIGANEPYKPGDGINAVAFSTMLQNIDSDFKSSLSAVSGTVPLTRIEGLRLVFKALSLETLALQLKELKSPFMDTSSDDAILNLAVKFKLISNNSTKTFRPNERLKIEEAYSLLWNLYKIKNLDGLKLHSYYAISSYSQINYTSDLESITFGWSRLEFDAATNKVLLNTTSANANEFHVPSGYTTALTNVNSTGISKQLMVFVNDIRMNDAATQSSKTLTEAIISNPEYTKQVIDGIISHLSNNPYQIYYDGVLIDFEGLKGTTNKANLNQFLTALNTALDLKGFTLGVAVHPARKTGLAYFDGYDFSKIGDLADFIILMAHDYYPKSLSNTEMNSGFAATPLAPLNEIYYALEAITDTTRGVKDPKKVFLQLSIDTAQWKIKDGRIINSTPYHPTYSAIASRIQSGVVPKFASSSSSPYLEFFDVDGTKNVVWYEDERSTQVKMDIAKLFGLGGFSVWRLGLIPENIWNAVIGEIEIMEK